MDSITIYKCLCDRQRLRILNLLGGGPLCVCHLMELLDSDQVKMSKQLRYMRELGMVKGERQAQWMVYRLAEPTHPLLDENLKCLQDCGGEDLGFRQDLKRREELIDRLRQEGSGCSESLLARQKVRCCSTTGDKV
ncbi:MAG: ArsR/SmtB family transcription factor [Opitutales bacterium]